MSNCVIERNHGDSSERRVNTSRQAFGRLAATLAASIATLSAAACGSSQIAGPSPEAARAIADVRQVTAGFHDFARAGAAGYTARLTECMSDAQHGGMGLHYGNPALIDGQVAVSQPEVLLYEPQLDGSLQLVGVEYIVPLSAWTAAAPPSLFGETFHRNEAFGLWALHVWAWRENPSGVFADWNPRVSCAAAR